jgi:hypothetical protein
MRDMGEAKRRRAAGEAGSPCRTCTLCCSILEIEALEKPMYRPCSHLAGHACGIWGQPQRPHVCAEFRCLHVVLREAAGGGTNPIEHPLDAGAYLAKEPGANQISVFVDPLRPERWKSSRLVGYLRPLVQRGFVLEIVDRGRRMEIGSAALFEEVLKLDYVAFADRQRRPLDYPSYAEFHSAE